MFAFPACLQAQEVLISDEGLKEPFQGRIGYKIRYSGNDLASIKGYLPDSVDVWFSPDFIRSTYYGGLSDSLSKDLLWGRELGRSYLIDRQNQTALYLPYDSLETKRPLPLKSGSAAEIVGINCQKYTFRDGKVSHAYWSSDSLLYPFKASDTALSSLPPFLHEKLPGLPLKFSTTSAMGTTTLTAGEVEAGKVPIAKGQIPNGYKEEPFKEFVVRHPFLKKD